MTTQLDRKTFDIREHIDSLTPSKKGKNYYECPVCNGNSLSIEPNSGKYQCWSGGCPTAEIREAISPWAEVLAESKGEARSSRVSSKKSGSKPKPRPATIPIGLKLLQLAEPAWDYPEAGKPSYFPKGVPQSAKQITYKYSDSQEVHRFEWPDTENPKGRDKTYRQRHIDADGKWKATKGDRVWPAYRLDEVIASLDDVGVNESVAVLMLEGEPNVELARSNGIVAITLQGSAWGDVEIEAMVSKLQATGKNIALAILRDNDSMGLKKALLVKAACDRLQFPCIIINPLAICPDIPDKGDIKEILDAMDSEEFIRRLEAEIHRSAAHTETEEEAIDRDTREGQVDGDEGPGGDESGKTAKTPSPRQIAHQLAEDYRSIWKFDNEQKTWRIWAEKTWEKLEIASFSSLIKNTIDAKNIDYKGFSYIADTIKLIECDLRQNYWQKWDRKRFINFKNGILDGDTGELLEHCPGSGFTSALPFEYKPLKGSGANTLQALEENCPNIHRWMNLAMRGNAKKVAKLLAIINGCLRFSFHGWQQFVHLIGATGSGKGTFTRLLEKVVGKENSQPCSLETLKDGSTLASIIDKQLVVFGDERKPVGVDTILRLTGGDTINYREIFTPAAKASFYGLLLICSNDPIFMGNTTGLERRLCLVAFDNPIPKALRNPEIEASFDDEIAALIAIALAMPSTEVAQSIKGIGDAEIADFKITEWEMKVRMDSLAAFFEMNLIVEEGARIQAGDLFKNYKDFCEDIKKPAMSLTTFSPGLEKLCTELHQPATRDKSGRHVTFIGLRLRKDEDAHPTYSQKLTALAGLDAGLAGLSAGLDAGLATIQGMGLQDLQDLSSNILEDSQILKTEAKTESSDGQEKIEKAEKTEIEKVSTSSPASPANPLQDKVLSPAPQVLYSPASPAIGDALNDSELELIEFIRGCEDMEGAINIQGILIECCDRNKADRGKIWAALSSEERSKYKSLLNPPQPAPESIAPPTEIGSSHKNLKKGDRVVITEHGNIHKGQIGTITDISVGIEANEYQIELDKPSHLMQSVMVEIPHNAPTPLLMRLNSEELPKKP